MNGTFWHFVIVKWDSRESREFSVAALLSVTHKINDALLFLEQIFGNFLTS